MRSQTTCTCKAYRFPHRAAGGQCVARQPGPYCGQCGEACEPVERDFGYGALEAWGHAFNHRDVHVVSDCCEAGMFHDASLTRPY